MIRQNNVTSKENLVMTEDVFSSAPFSLPGKISVLINCGSELLTIVFRLRSVLQNYNSRD